MIVTGVRSVVLERRYSPCVRMLAATLLVTIGVEVTVVMILV